LSIEYVIVVAPTRPAVLRATVNGDTYHPFVPAVPDTMAETCSGLGGGTTTACVTTGLREAVYVASPRKLARR
jgi:hypothetical protein